MTTDGNGFDAFALFNEWSKMVGKPAPGLFDWWTEAARVFGERSKPLNDQGNLQDFMQLMMNAAKTGMSTAWQARKADEMFPDFFKKLFQGEASGGGTGIWNSWSGVTEQGSVKWNRVPAVGMLRFYQERFLKFMERLGTLQGSYKDFTKIMQGPLEKASRDLQARVAELAMKGKAPAGMEELYGIWLEILEKQYMEVMRSPEFLDSLKEVLRQTQMFKKARDEFFRDLLQFLPIPTNTEMDALYKELYRLKKEVADLKASAAGGKAVEPKE